MAKSAGIHHITGIAGNPRTHVEFYTRVLGLRLVKRTVNFDDPRSWHLYYGNETGAPGTALTFFIWPDAARGRPGMAQAVETFKIKAEQKAREEAEAKIRQDRIAAEQRKADMYKMADDF